jgi:hypothetical protein
MKNPSSVERISTCSLKRRCYLRGVLHAESGFVKLGASTRHHGNKTSDDGPDRVNNRPTNFWARQTSLKPS